MDKFVDTNEIVIELGGAITAALKKHGIAPGEVKVNVLDDQIRILVMLEDKEE